MPDGMDSEPQAGQPHVIAKHHDAMKRRFHSLARPGGGSPERYETAPSLRAWLVRGRDEAGGGGGAGTRPDRTGRGAAGYRAGRVAGTGRDAWPVQGGTRGRYRARRVAGTGRDAAAAAGRWGGG